jgi:hypothetical protein
MVPIMPWCTLGDPLQYIPGSYHKTTTFVIENNVSPFVVVLFVFCFEDKQSSPKLHEDLTQSTTEIVVLSSTVDDSPHCTTMYMYLRGGSTHFHKEGPVLLQKKNLISKPFVLKEISGKITKHGKIK